MRSTVILDESLRAAIAQAADQAPRKQPGTWVRKPPVLPRTPLRAQRDPRPAGRPQVPAARHGVRGAQLKLFDLM